MGTRLQLQDGEILGAVAAKAFAHKLNDNK